MDTIDYIRSIPARLKESGLQVPAFFAFECPIPGTPLFHRMAARLEPAFLPNALLCDFNGYTMVLRPGHWQSVPGKNCKTRPVNEFEYFDRTGSFRMVVRKAVNNARE